MLLTDRSCRPLPVAARGNGSQCPIKRRSGPLGASGQRRMDDRNVAHSRRSGCSHDRQQPFRVVHRLGLFDTCLEQRRCRAWRRPEGRCWTTLEGGNRGVCRRGRRRRSDYGDSADSLEVPALPELKHRGVTPVEALPWASVHAIRQWRRCPRSPRSCRWAHAGAAGLE
jgi:hypothetical protein